MTYEKRAKIILEAIDECGPTVVSWPMEQQWIKAIVQGLRTVDEAEKETEVYQNEDNLCECWLCELRGRCQYRDKYQRLPRTNSGALGLCRKLNQEAQNADRKV